MINQYQIIDYSYLGIPSVEVKGNEFHYLDLFELVGSEQFMTTFYFKEDSEAYNRYGKCVNGVVYYGPKDIEKLNDNKTDGIDLNKIRIDSPENFLSSSQRRELKAPHGGIQVADIESIGFLSYKKKSELLSTGEKKVPNLVEVKLEGDSFDHDMLCRGFLVSKIDRGWKLIQFEIEQLIGITLGIDGYIDLGTLRHFGFDEDSFRKNINILYHFYKVKERRGILTDEEKKEYQYICEIQLIKKFEKFIEELKRSGVAGNELEKKQDVLKKIIESCKSFQPCVLLPGKKQVYWDIDSYLHIVMRHVKGFQLGSFKTKTTFPYREKDLKKLIEKVLDRVQDDYEDHISNNPDKDFFRMDNGAVAFNGDYYNLRIDPSGRLYVFYPVFKQ